MIFRLVNWWLITLSGCPLENVMSIIPIVQNTVQPIANFQQTLMLHLICERLKPQSDMLRLKYNFIVITASTNCAL